MYNYTYIDKSLLINTRRSSHRRRWFSRYRSIRVRLIFIVSTHPRLLFISITINYLVKQKQCESSLPFRQSSHRIVPSRIRLMNIDGAKNPHVNRYPMTGINYARFPYETLRKIPIGFCFVNNTISNEYGTAYCFSSLSFSFSFFFLFQRYTIAYSLQNVIKSLHVRCFYYFLQLFLFIRF